MTILRVLGSTRSCSSAAKRLAYNRRCRRGYRGTRRRRHWRGTASARPQDPASQVQRLIATSWRRCALSAPRRVSGASMSSTRPWPPPTRRRAWRRQASAPRALARTPSRTSRASRAAPQPPSPTSRALAVRPRRVTRPRTSRPRFRRCGRWASVPERPRSSSARWRACCTSGTYASRPSTARPRRSWMPHHWTLPVACSACSRQLSARRSAPGRCRHLGSCGPFACRAASRRRGRAGTHSPGTSTTRSSATWFSRPTAQSIPGRGRYSAGFLTSSASSSLRPTPSSSSASTTPTNSCSSTLTPSFLRMRPHCTRTRAWYGNPRTSLTTAPSLQCCTSA
mmetsp:Transcript_91714/g.296773  ORF Transcript_91714/g.296773 Transcript_91714/m.296773 type:complete len:339 (+) Transcript_91714:902-1918(+)